MLVLNYAASFYQYNVPHLEQEPLRINVRRCTRLRRVHIKTIKARVTRNIKEDPSIEECNIWNIQATFIDPLPSDAGSIITDPIEIGVRQLEVARTDSTRTAVTIRTQKKSPLLLGEMIHLGFE